MTQTTFRKLGGLVFMFMSAAAIGKGIVQSQNQLEGTVLRRTPQSEFRAALFSPNGKYLVTVGDQAIIKVWDVASGQLLHALFPPAAQDQIDPYSDSPLVVFGPDSDTFIARWAGLTKRWDTASGQLIGNVDQLDLEDRDLRFSKQGQPTAGWYDNLTSSIPVSIGGTEPSKGKTREVQMVAYGAVYSEDFRISATVRGPSRDEIEIWSLETGKRLYSLLATQGSPSNSTVTPPDSGTVYKISFAPESRKTSQSDPLAKVSFAPLALLMRPCRPSITIGGRLTRRTDVFGDDEPSYRPVKGEPIFLWDVNGNELARTRTDRNGDYSFPGLCSGTYTVHPGIASPLLPSFYDPSERTTTVPAPVNQVASPAHLDFVRKQPPPPRQPEFPRAG